MLFKTVFLPRAYFLIKRENEMKTYKRTCYWIFECQPFEPPWHVNFSWLESWGRPSSLFRSSSRVSREALFVDTLAQALSHVLIGGSASTCLPLITHALGLRLLSSLLLKWRLFFLLHWGPRNHLPWVCWTCSYQNSPLFTSGEAD